MLDLHPKYIADAERNCKAVQISIGEWEKVLEALEELEDIRVYEEARAANEDTISLDELMKEIAKSK